MWRTLERNMKRTLKESIETNLKKSGLWKDKVLQDCENQNVLLTIRNNRIDLYHKGGRLFTYNSNGFKTHQKYASVITKAKNDYLTESELSKSKLASDFKSNYQQIKKNCSKYSGIEASGISEIYHKHSYLSDSNVVVLDIEVSFESLNEKNKQDRIDLVLFNKKSQTLQFVEAKHFSNKDLWSNTTPKVISQISRYESQISNPKQNILSEYKEYTEILNRIFDISLPEPKNIEDKVTLLIFGFDNDQKNGRLKKLITKNEEYASIKKYSFGDIKKVVLANLWKA